MSDFIFEKHHVRMISDREKEVQQELRRIQRLQEARRKELLTGVTRIPSVRFVNNSRIVRQQFARKSEEQKSGSKILNPESGFFHFDNDGGRGGVL